MSSEAGAAQHISVWAPDASKAELVVDGQGLPMEPIGDGWHRSCDPVAPGQGYRIRLDEEPPRPDPRSQWQPEGVHGVSCTVDHRAFPWSDGAWKGYSLADAVLYELHVGTFSPEGTFDGAAARLGHLVDLGVNAVEIMPVAQFPGDRGWGYDGVDLYAPLEAYGGPDGLKRLVDACHGRGLAVVLDVVYNHLGPDGNYLGSFGPYFTDRYATPWGQALNLDGPRSGPVRRFIADNALMWLRDYHLDGLRLDAVHAIVDTSAVHILEQLEAEVTQLANALGRRLWLIAESDRNDPRLVRDRALGGYGLDAQWSDDFHHALHAAITGETTGYYADFGTVADVATALRNAYVYAGRYSRFRQREHGRPATGIPGTRFLGYLQNHDQVGNRALGERSSHLMGPGQLEAAAALVLTAPFVPMLFQGEEWAASTPFQYFTDHRDPELARAVSEGRRREHGIAGRRPEDVPDPQDPQTFARSRLDWDERARPPHDAILAWHRELIALRRSDSGLRDGRLDEVRTAWDEQQRWIVVQRPAATVVANLGEGPVAVPVGSSPPLAGWLLSPTVAPGARLDKGTLRLPGAGAAVLARARDV